MHFGVGIRFGKLDCKKFSYINDKVDCGSVFEFKSGRRKYVVKIDSIKYLNNGSQSILTEVYGEGGKINLIRTCLSDHGRLKLLMDTKKETATLIDFAPSTIRQAVGNAFETARISQPDPAEGVSDERENRDCSVGPQAAETERMLSSQEEFLATLKADFPKYPLIVFPSPMN